MKVAKGQRRGIGSKTGSASAVNAGIMQFREQSVYA